MVASSLVASLLGGEVTGNRNDRVHTRYVVSQDFLQMKEKWTRKNNEDVDEQDARQEFAQTKTPCVRQDCFLRM